ncbi:MAG: hypothetical protein A3E84_03580 [Gammaproteobacteria bacterium RIFCSPHIGHO2_12_FULL_42_13]|nr:MAG: hypothetical protein A3E84_03580 [Gammaproteobacteria bacterium RIFCSPHIGHO2_12_FULL_42_13]
MKGLIIIPTYNERDNIAALIKSIFALPLQHEHTLSIVVIDDASPDGTAAIVHALIPHYPDKLFLIERQNERGRGSAGIKGFLFCLTQQVDCIIEMDADFSHDPNYLPLFLDMSSHYDIVIGSRFVQGGNDAYRKTYRALLSIVANSLYRVCLGMRLRDISSGYKCYRKEVLAQLDFNRFFSKGYPIGMETLYRSYLNEVKFIEIPIHFKERHTGISKFILREAADSLWIVIRLCWKYRISKLLKTVIN